MIKILFLVSFTFAVLFVGSIPLNPAHAQFQGGGVDHPGKWWVGEGLKKGDYFSYKLCHIDYKECASFQIDFWIEGDIKVGTEQKWLAQVVVYDGNKVVTGTMELGKVAPEPSGGTPELGPYRGAFKSSIVWLSAYATADIGIEGKGPKKFSAPSWGKIANIGGEQIIPTKLEKISVPGGTFETILIAFKTGGASSKVWVVDDFPFPIKAATWTQVAEGIPPPEYQFELLNYKQNVSTNPFSDVVDTKVKQKAIGCPATYDLVTVKKTTKNFLYLIELKYGPSDPKVGCEIEWFINFKNKFDETEFLNQVQYDILVVDEKLKPIRSVANDEGRKFFYTHSGQILKKTLVEEAVGTANYVIWVYGTSPETILPPPEEVDYLQINIPISSGATTVPKQQIPVWVKNNAGWWSSGQIGDSDFVLGIQYLINQGIMKIPSTSAGTGTGSQEIPTWIKNNAGWWANGQISDNDFVQGIQFLISNGIMKIRS